jgi:hypothetical protein
MIAFNQYSFTCIVLIVAFAGCNNIEDADLSKRTTFIKTFATTKSVTASAAEPLADGYVIVGTTEDNDEPVAVVIRTDKNGIRIGDNQYIPGGTGKAIKPLPGGGYIVVGDSIKRLSNPGNVNNFVVSSARILILNDALGVVGNPVYITDDRILADADARIDYHGISVTINQAGQVIVLGSYKEADDLPEKPFIKAFTYTNGSLTELWGKKYDLIDRNYRIAKSVLYNETTNDIIWATAVANEQQDLNFSYVGFPVVEENSTYKNFDKAGETTEQLFQANDIQPLISPTFGIIGYGAVGTYGAVNLTNRNIFFCRIYPNGQIIKDSERYFDAIASANNTALEQRAFSSIEDTGESLCATSNGYVIAANYVSTPFKGKGGRDIFLIKLNHNGDPVWNKSLGGTGDEVISTIREDNEGNLIICGTNTLGGFSSIFLIKTDKNGELKK